MHTNNYETLLFFFIYKMKTEDKKQFQLSELSYSNMRCHVVSEIYKLNIPVLLYYFPKKILYTKKILKRDLILPGKNLKNIWS